MIAGWGSTRMAARGRLHDIAALPGFVAEDGGRWLGHAACDVRDGALEVALLEASVEQVGAGSALLAACVTEAARRRLGRLWLITTNDNTAALRFYQRRGFRLVALHRDAVTHARRQLKPEIPLAGKDGIPLRDEIELELPADEWASFVERYSWPSS